MTAPGTNASSSQASNPLNSPVTIPAVMFIFGVVGNLVAIVVLCKSRKEQKETTSTHWYAGWRSPTCWARCW